MSYKQMNQSTWSLLKTLFSYVIDVDYCLCLLFGIVSVTEPMLDSQRFSLMMKKLSDVYRCHSVNAAPSSTVSLLTWQIAALYLNMTSDEELPVWSLWVF